MVANLAEKNVISEAEYLEGEKIGEIKHEYIDGEVYAMAGASREHNTVSSNISRHFGNHLENTSCLVFSSDMKIKAGNDFYYPDVIVVCDDDGDSYYTEAPIIIVEVLSKSTRRRDKVTKMNAYKTIPQLQEYVMIEQDYVDVEICRRKNNWVSEHFYLGDELTFESLDLSLSVEAIYQKVKNEDMLQYLQQQAQN